MALPQTTVVNKPKPPPVQQGAQVNQGKQCCQYAVHKPCDVDKLMLTVTAYDDNWDKNASSSATVKVAGPGKKTKLTLKLQATAALKYRKAPTDPAGAKLHAALQPRNRRGGYVVGPDHPARLLQSYDLLIDCIADFPKVDKPGPGAPAWKNAFFQSLKPDPEDLATVEFARAYFHSTATCEHQTHALLKIKALGATAADLPHEIVLQKPGAAQLEKQDLKLWAPSFPVADLPTTGFILFELVKSLLSCAQPKNVEFIAQSCGKRAKGDAKELQPNDDLKALLRIYRRDKFTIGVKIPPLGSFKDHRTADKISGDSERKREISGAGGLVTQTVTSKTEGNHTSRADERFVAHKGWSVEEGKLGDNQYTARRFSDADGVLLDKTGSHSLSQVGMRLKRSSGFTLVVAHNDREINVVEFYEKFKKAIETFGKLITNFRSLFKLVPKVGWTFDFSVSVFEGWVGLEWAPCYVDNGKPIYDERYCPVEYKWKGRVELVLIDLKVSVGFGVEINLADVAELTCKIEGSLSFKAKVAHDINMDLFKPKERVEIETSCVPALAAVVNLSVFGYTLVGGVLQVAGGLELKGCLEIEWGTKTFDLIGVLKRKPVLLTGHVQYPVWFGLRTKTRKIDPPVEIIGEGDIHTFR